MHAKPNMQNDGNQKHPSRRAASGKGSREHRFSNAVGACNETRSAMDNPPSLKHEHLSKQMDSSSHWRGDWMVISGHFTSCTLKTYLLEFAVWKFLRFDTSVSYLRCDWMDIFFINPQCTTCLGCNTQWNYDMVPVTTTLQRFSCWRGVRQRRSEASVGGTTVCAAEDGTMTRSKARTSPCTHINSFPETLRSCCFLWCVPASQYLCWNIQKQTNWHGGVTGASLYQTAIVTRWDAVKGRRGACK